MEDSFVSLAYSEKRIEIHHTQELNFEYQIPGAWKKVIRISAIIAEELVSCCSIS